MPTLAVLALVAGQSRIDPDEFIGGDAKFWDCVNRARSNFVPRNKRFADMV